MSDDKDLTPDAGGIASDIESAFAEVENKEAEAWQKAAAGADLSATKTETDSAVAITGQRPESQGAGSAKEVSPLPRSTAPAPAESQGKAEAKTDAIEPPLNWSGKAKINWGRLPRDVQAAIASDYGRIGEIESKYSDLERVLAPRSNTIAAEFGSPAAFVQRMLQLSDFAERDPAQFIAWFAKNRGVDLAQFLAPQQQAQAAPQDPHVSALQQRLAQLEQLQMRHLQSLNQQAYRSDLDTVTRFLSDPSKPYASELRIAMADLIDSGQAKDLNEAYEKAVWLHPETREAMLAERVEQQRKAKAEEAERARRAGRSVSGAPSTSIVNGHQNDDILGAITSAFDEIEARA